MKASFCEEEVVVVDDVHTFENDRLLRKKVKTFSKFRHFGEAVTLKSLSFMEDFSARTIWGSLVIEDCVVLKQHFRHLEKVEGDVVIVDSWVEDFSALKKIGGNCYVANSTVRMSALEEICGQSMIYNNAGQFVKMDRLKKLGHGRDFER